MTIDFPVNYSIHDLTISGFTLRNVYNSLVQNISATIDDTVLAGTENPMSDQSDNAPWFDGSGWNVFDPSINDYKSTRVQVGSISLSAAPSANRLQQLQNKSGTVALLDDVYGIRPTITLQEGLVSVDWNIATSFRVILSGNRTSSFYMMNSMPGMRIKLLIVNSGTNQVVGAWDSNINWPAGTAPSMPASTPGAAKSLLVIIRNINGTLYGESVSQEQKSLTSTDISFAQASLRTGGTTPPGGTGGHP